jgi:hypothetical protein
MTTAKSTKRSNAKTRKRAAKAKAPAPTQDVDPEIAEAAAEVLEAVFLHEKHFDLESAIVRKDGRPIIEKDAEGHYWATVKLHVPMLDIDTWIDGTHLDHPDNQAGDAEEDA